ncbi:MAG: RNA 2',3'-cyclic phosphodiesterase [Thermoleophilia bacterium]|nr:RNA 2',3'-cyclic phosphodiesterase [Gaiellaceae bacterium]MDW8338305.1 RNA 2',3'-cyclic phosphodiesterase [Thermoleophilia bacterium]
MIGAATVAGDERLRLFLALELPDDVRASLRSWAQAHLRGGRLPAELHVTLAFLGSQQRSDLERILRTLREAAAEAAPFTLEPVRYRETRSVGMLVLTDPSGEATRLADRLQRRLEELGLYTRERRPWLPHVTVVRFRKRLGLVPPLPEVGPFAPSGAAAFLSCLHPSGARYEVLESCPLGASHPRVSHSKG